MLAVWQAADDIDVFESGWTFDHFYPIFTDSTGPCLEGWTTLTALAQATKRLRLGTLVTGVTYRNPAILAKQVTTLDVISGGRFVAGFPVGSSMDLASLLKRLADDREKDAVGKTICEHAANLSVPMDNTK